MSTAQAAGGNLRFALTFLGLDHGVGFGPDIGDQGAKHFLIGVGGEPLLDEFDAIGYVVRERGGVLGALRQDLQSAF